AAPAIQRAQGRALSRGPPATARGLLALVLPRTGTSPRSAPRSDRMGADPWAQRDDLVRAARPRRLVRGQLEPRAGSAHPREDRAPGPPPRGRHDGPRHDDAALSG